MCGHSMRRHKSSYQQRSQVLDFAGKPELPLILLLL